MHTEYQFHTAFLVIMMVMVALRMYYAGYADGASGVTQTTKGEGSFRWIRMILGIPLAVGYLSYVFVPTSMSWSQLLWPEWVRWLGVPCAGLAIGLLAWVQRHLSQNFTGTTQIRPHGFVVKTGPYQYVRHPMYLTFILLGVSFWLLTANYILGGGFLLVILIVMFVRTPIEEQALKKAYSKEYEAYMKTTGRFWPRWKS